MKAQLDRLEITISGPRNVTPGHPPPASHRTRHPILHDRKDDHSYAEQLVASDVANKDFDTLQNLEILTDALTEESYDDSDDLDQLSDRLQKAKTDQEIYAVTIKIGEFETSVRDESESLQGLAEWRAWLAGLASTGVFLFGVTLSILGRLQGVSIAGEE